MKEKTSYLQGKFKGKRIIRHSDKVLPEALRPLVLRMYQLAEDLIGKTMIASVEDKSVSISFYIIDHSAPEAYACKDRQEKDYVVIMTSSFLSGMHKIFFEASKTLEFWRLDPRDKTRTIFVDVLPPGLFPLIFSPNRKSLYVESWGNLAPKSSAEIYANKAFFLFFEFVMGHELGHICNGHVDWFGKNAHIGRINEIKGSSLIDNSISRALEYDADCFSGKLGLFRTIDLHFDDTDRRVWESFVCLNSIPNAFAVQIRARQYAISLFFMLQEEFEKRVKQENSSHPPSIFRHMNLIRYGDMYIRKTARNTLPELFDLLASWRHEETSFCGFSDAETAFLSIVGRQSNRSGYFRILGQEGGKILDEILGSYSQIYNDLNQLKLGGTLAPPRDS
ncbi:hypothetical protein RADP37_05283 [Roseomonas mucosa]|uniref:Uncharacterized protein n=1 Tax=Roseomonas mucosa TaxID=207340 RepID=A0A4Y1MS85_9PROT|nr:hypothetical protein RADP37_05283 [Roseomonas mucosa]